MKLNRDNFPITLSAIVLFAATIYFLIAKNYEFIIYAVTLSVLIAILYKTDKYLNYMKPAKWGFFIWMVLHMAGGSMYIAGTRLYDVILINIFGEPYNILKYDQFVHFFCYVVITLLMYSALVKITKNKPDKFMFGLILILAASSVGAVNEIIEFSAVVMFESNGVGGYYNTALDLCFNLIGAIVATLYLKYVRKSKYLN